MYSVLLCIEWYSYHCIIQYSLFPHICDVDIVYYATKKPEIRIKNVCIDVIM